MKIMSIKPYDDYNNPPQERRSYRSGHNHVGQGF